MNKNLLPYGLAGGALALASFLIWNGVNENASDPQAKTAEQGKQGRGSIQSQVSSPRSQQSPRAVVPVDQEVSEAASAHLAKTLQHRIARHGRKSSATSSHPSSSFKLVDFLSAGGSFTVRERVTGIESLRQAGSLSDEDRAAALEALQNTITPEGITAPDWHWIVDELITSLRVDGADNSALSEALAGVATNTEQDPVVRDYALQHLGHLREEGGDLQVIDTTLNSALAEKQNTLAGTALLALNNYTDDPTLGQSALAMAGDSDYDLRSRLTAMQVAGKQENLDALPLAVNVASDTSQPVVLRMTAIATIGDLNAVEHHALLQELANSPDSRLQKAAVAALAKHSQP